MARFVLIHGAWHGAWCWEVVAPRLAALGHDVCAPDLPGMGADADLGHVATLDEWAMFVAGIASADSGPAILVGHSRGGIVISRAAELAPRAVRRLVYLAAVMPRSGEAMGSMFDDPELTSQSPLNGAVGISANGLTMTLNSQDAALRAFYNTSPPERAQAAFARLTPEPLNMQATPVLLSESRYGSVPRSYILCEQDRSLPVRLQRQMIDRQPCDAYTLDTDHSPFYSAPVELAAMLDDISRR